MPNLRDLRQRITSVGNIQKITRAMEMVATTRLRRFQDRAVAARPYSESIAELVRRLGGAVAANPGAAGTAAPLFLSGAPGAPEGILFVGSDRGLCGAYNSNVQRRLDEEVAGRERPVRLFVIGRKAMQHAAKRGYDVAAYLEEHILERLSFQDAASISGLLVREFREGRLGRVDLCFTRFHSMVRYDPVVEPLLPIAAPAADAALQEPILEPGGPELLARLVPVYLETTIHHALLEALTSEFAARRFAMKNATDAAAEMKREITRSYNKARQAKITSEILEIVAGAEAL